MAKLSQAAKFLAVEFQNAQNLREASTMHGDVRNQLASGVQDIHKDGFGYGYYVDHSGDGASGDVVYQSNGKLKKASYSIGKTEDGKRSVSIAHDKAKNVTAVTSYKESNETASESDRTRQDSADNSKQNGARVLDIQAMDRVLQERFSGLASSERLALIEKLTTVARGTVPDNQSTWKPDGVLLCEGSKFLEAPRLAEAVTTDYPIKLISPGRGSSGYYPPSVLQKAAENKVFKAGTQMFWNHDTDAEEATRPEGDLDRLAAVTTSDAAWNENGSDGPGLYARAKVFSDYADKVKEKGPHIGLSIRAGGHRDEAAVGPDGKKGVITALKNAASVDFVTKAGRDGKIFTESATAQEGEEMDKAEIQALFKESLDAALAPLRAENKKLTEAIAQQNLEKKVPGLVKRTLEGVRLPEATITAIVEKFSTPTIMALLPMKEGAVDETELGKMVEAEAVRQRDYLVALGFNSDLPAQGVRMTEAELKQTDEQRAKESTALVESLADIFVGEKRDGDKLRDGARLAFVKGRAA